MNKYALPNSEEAQLIQKHKATLTGYKLIWAVNFSSQVRTASFHL